MAQTNICLIKLLNKVILNAVLLLNGIIINCNVTVMMPVTLLKSKQLKISTILQKKMCCCTVFPLQIIANTILKFLGSATAFTRQMNK